MKTKLNKRACKQCGVEFQKQRPLDMFCGPICASKYRYAKEAKKVEEKPRKQLKQISHKRRDLHKIYKIVRKAYLLKVPNCERCKGEAIEIHHKNGRTNERLVDVNYFMATCRACHVYIHNNPEEARKNKWLV